MIIGFSKINHWLTHLPIRLVLFPSLFWYHCHQGKFNFPHPLPWAKKVKLSNFLGRTCFDGLGQLCEWTHIRSIIFYPHSVVFKYQRITIKPAIAGNAKKIKFPKTNSGRQRLCDGLEFIRDQGGDTKECWTLGQIMRSSIVWWWKNTLNCPTNCQDQLLNQLMWFWNLPAHILFHCLRVVDCAASKKFQGNPSYEVQLGSKLIDWG